MSSISAFTKLKEIEREKRKKIILYSIIELLENKTISEINIRDIAKNVGISNSTVYIYFSNRDQMLFELLIQEICSLKEKIDKSNMLEINMETHAMNGIDLLLENDIIVQLLTYFMTNAANSRKIRNRLGEVRLLLFDFIDTLLKGKSGSQQDFFLNHVFFAGIVGSYFSLIYFPGMNHETKRKHMHELARELIHGFCTPAGLNPDSTCALNIT